MSLIFHANLFSIRQSVFLGLVQEMVRMFWIIYGNLFSSRKGVFLLVQKTVGRKFWFTHWFTIRLLWFLYVVTRMFWVIN